MAAGIRTAASGRVDVARSAAKDGTRPIRRTPRSTSLRRGGWLPERAKVPRDLLRLGHERDEAESSRATRAGQNVEREGPHHELGPCAIATAAGSRLGLRMRSLEHAGLRTSSFTTEAEKHGLYQRR